MEIFTNETASKLYNHIYDWLASYTPDSHARISKFQYYQKNIWNILYKKYYEIINKKELSFIEKDFIESVFYKGKIYRVQKYNFRNKGHVYEMSNLCASWSKKLKGVSNLTNFNGSILLLVAKATLAVDTIGLLEFLFSYYKIDFEDFKHPQRLQKYFEEYEVINPINFKEIKGIFIVDKSKVTRYKKYSITLAKEKWKRKKL